MEFTLVLASEAKTNFFPKKNTPFLLCRFICYSKWWFCFVIEIDVICFQKNRTICLAQYNVQNRFLFSSIWSGLIIYLRIWAHRNAKWQLFLFICEWWPIYRIEHSIKYTENWREKKNRLNLTIEKNRYISKLKEKRLWKIP